MVALILISVALTSICGSVPRAPDPPDDDVWAVARNSPLLALLRAIRRPAPGLLRALSVRRQNGVQTLFCSPDRVAIRMRTLSSMQCRLPMSADAGKPICFYR